MRRRLHRMPRRLLAEMVGRSEEWLRLIETGRLRLDSVEMILRLAEVLQIPDFRDLIELPVRETGHHTDPAGQLIEALEPIVLAHPVTAADTAAGPSADRRNHHWLADEVADCAAIWADSPRRYSQLALRLPHLLAAGRCWNQRLGTGSAELSLPRAYHLTREVLTQLGAHHLAAIAADRARLLARTIGHPHLLAAGGWHWASALLQMGEDRHAHTFALATARRDLPDDGTLDTDVVRGALELLAAEAAARTDLAEAARLLAAAQERARRVGDDRRILGIGFGTCEVELTRMEIALSRRDIQQVMDSAATVHRLDVLPIGRRTRYFIILATAYTLQGDIAAATLALGRAAESSPEDLRFDGDVHAILRTLLRHQNQLVRDKIAHLVNVAGIA
ncbi:hypothetical protein [Nocardia grenadensis]|uniref:hypothetical protein n=1 Tax=Nocardia grenadensis TaxID=931537 RepID=UPI003D8F01E6